MSKEEFLAAMAKIRSFESHNFWSISDTVNVVELCSEVWFQEYTENSPHEPYLDDKQVTTT